MSFSEKVLLSVQIQKCHSSREKEKGGEIFLAAPAPLSNSLNSVLRVFFFFKNKFIFTFFFFSDREEGKKKVLKVLSENHGPPMVRSTRLSPCLATTARWNVRVSGWSGTAQRPKGV
jgi:predicted PurR-regulated permease PerM